MVMRVNGFGDIECEHYTDDEDDPGLRMRSYDGWQRALPRKNNTVSNLENLRARVMGTRKSLQEAMNAASNMNTTIGDEFDDRDMDARLTCFDTGGYVGVCPGVAGAWLQWTCMQG
ncbi:unnamed protein product [Dovyalis caffra]|uniref:Uncharacterized protein n=1 Tax=Dovyalis caffra TaxID=77055 RepID=A0AAV1SHC7_9ROSI|nr:unnamed protein product [Dovyalis caffra]